MSNAISVIGLGKLGLPLCVVLASRGFHVIGVDLDREIVDLCNLGKIRINEPQVEQLLNRFKHSIRATTDYSDALSNSSVTFLILPTPSDKDGFFTNQHILQAIESISPILKDKDKYHLISIVSTVMPGSMDNEIKNTLERLTERKIGENLGLCYSPEFIALGNVVNDLLNPDMVLIGESDRDAGNKLEKIYYSLCDNHPPIMRMNFVNAEITKIAVNTYVTTKISFINMLSELCEKLPTGDIDVVANAMGKDSRIGTKYLKAGGAYGGPCFPRDNVAFSNLAHKLGARADIAQATDVINDYQIERIVSAVKQFDSKKKIGILGLSYKPLTNIVDESTGMKLANLLYESNYKVCVYDPMVLQSARKFLNEGIFIKSSLQDCVNDSDILIITTEWAEFRGNLKYCLEFSSHLKRTILDIWRILPFKEFSRIANLHYFGCGSS